MSKQVKSLGICFENCECVDIDVDKIDRLGFGEITKTSYYYRYTNTMMEHLRAKEFYVVFRMSPFGIFDEGMHENLSVGTRIEKYMDVTQISVNYVDGSNENYYVTWGGEDTGRNEAQKFFEEFGMWVLEIK